MRMSRWRKIDRGIVQTTERRGEGATREVAGTNMTCACCRSHGLLMIQTSHARARSSLDYLPFLPSTIETTASFVYESECTGRAAGMRKFPSFEPLTPNGFSLMAHAPDRAPIRNSTPLLPSAAACEIVIDIPHFHFPNLFCSHCLSCPSQHAPLLSPLFQTSILSLKGYRPFPFTWS